MTSRYIILGGGGCFGLHLSQYLLEEGRAERVVGIGLNPPKSEPFSLAIGRGDARYRYAAVDVRDSQSLLDCIDAERPDVIVNFAAEGEAAASWTESWRYFETNCVALARLVEGLSDRDYLRRFIQISTIEVYGSVSHAVTETDALRPSSPYSASKAAADHHLLSMHRVKGFPANIVRPTNTYGPGQQLHRVIPKAVLCGLTGEKLPLQGGGAAVKPYLHARDLAAAIHAVARSAPSGAVYNVGPDEPISIRGLMELTAEALGIGFDALCVVTDARPGEDARYDFDSSAIRRALGWRAETDLRSGLRDMVAWGRQYLAELRSLPRTYQPLR
jgi:dTDP-glucose 4,6-dehydratase